MTFRFTYPSFGYSRDIYSLGLPLRLAASSTYQGATGIQTTDGLLYGAKWSGTISYSFPDRRLDYEAGYTEASNGFAPVSFGQAQAVRFILEGRSSHSGGPRMALTSVEGFTNASLVDAGFDGADIRIAQSRSANPTSYAYLPTSHPYGGDVWFGRAHNYTMPIVGTYEFATVIHELGHSLGLKHPQEAGGVSNVAVPVSRNSLEYTVMTYNSYALKAGETARGYYTSETYGYPQTYMMYDIAALQAMYGADFKTRSGNSVYTWSAVTGEAFINGVGQGVPGSGIGGSANRIFETMWDGGGTDTFDLSNYTSDLRIDLRPGQSSVLSPVQLAYLGDGHYSRGNVFNALQYNGDPRSLIENASGGSGSDRIVGNVAKNTLKGGFGNDTLYGMHGNDILWGGPGADAFVFNTTPKSRTNIDRLPDFAHLVDKINLTQSIYTALAKGPLASTAFYVGNTAHTLADRIIYDPTSGGLIYDRDGTGLAAPIKFAAVNPGALLSEADIQIS
jgi:serralysin